MDENPQSSSKRDVKPLFLKLGVAFSLSLAGYLRLRGRPSSSSAAEPPTHVPDSGLDEEILVPTSAFVSQKEESLVKTVDDRITDTVVAPPLSQSKKREKERNNSEKTDFGLDEELLVPTSAFVSQKEESLAKTVEDTPATTTDTVIALLSQSKKRERERNDSEKIDSDLDEELLVPTSAFGSQKAETLVDDTSTTTTDTVIALLSQSKKSCGDEEGFLLPEFNQLVMEEFEASGEDSETISSTPIGSKLEIEKEIAMEEEICYLRKLVDCFQERERTLEIQMLEYHGLKEQEAAISELENRLKINTMEAKLFSMKIESLQAENQSLRAEALDYPITKKDLQLAQALNRFLKRKLKSDGEQTKEKISALEQRITMLQDMEHKNEKDDEDIEKKLRRLNELEDEAMNLKMVNIRLTEEITELMLKLKSTQMSTSSIVKGPEVVPLEEVVCLREDNDKLKKDIEQLHTDRCADIEELVYLRWINACLRYELRNYQPLPEKTVARDLSRSLSPKSEQMAKQLIVEYANFGIDERNMSLVDFDSDCCSSQASVEELDDTSVDISSTKSRTTRKLKFISKLKKLVLGKGNHNSVSSINRTPTCCGNSVKKTSGSTCSFEDTNGRTSNDSPSSCISVELSSANQLTGVGSHFNEHCQNKGDRRQNFSRPPMDFQGPGRLNTQEMNLSNCTRCKSDAGTSNGYKSMMSVDDNPIDLSPNGLLSHVEIDLPEVELRKFAEALKGSRASPKLKKRAASFSFS